MMSNTKTGGPAFPQASYNMAGGYDTKGGMTLRDYFAAMAMQARCLEKYSDWKYLAQDAYNIADAMLAERDKGDL